MNKVEFIITIIGIIIILTAPLLGTNMATLYLGLLGGMETEKYHIIIASCNLGIQIIGALIVAYGLFAHKKGDDESR